MLHDALGLGALSGTRRSKQDHGTYITRGFLRHRRWSKPSDSSLPGVQRATEVQQPLSGPNRLRPIPAAANASAARRKPIVVAHDQLRLDLGNRIHGYAYDNQQRSTAKIELHAQTDRHTAGQ